MAIHNPTPTRKDESSEEVFSEYCFCKAIITDFKGDKVGSFC